MLTSYFKTIFQSFYTATPYIAALRSWRGYGLKYLLLVTLLSSLFITISWMWSAKHLNTERLTDIILESLLPRTDLSFEENINRTISILSQTPEIQIKNGKVETVVTQPYLIKDPLLGGEIAIIDTTGYTKSLAKTNAKILLTDTKLIIKNDNNREDVSYIHDIQKHYNINENTLNDLLFIISQIPEFSLHGDKFVTRDNNLYKIYNKNNIELAQVGEGAELQKHAKPIISISPSEISYKNIFNDKVSVIQSSDFNRSLLFDIINSGLISIKSIILWFIPLLVLPIIVFVSFLLNLIVLLFYTFIGYWFIKIKKLGSFAYKDVMRVAVVATTPILIVSAVIPKIIPSQGIIYFLITIGYLYYAVRAVTTPELNSE